jgi:cytidylate kinase
MDGLADRLRNIQLDFRYDRDNQKFETILNGHNVEDEIRSLRVSDHVSQISKIGQVRDKMVEIQRKLGKHKRIVMDGRDIGTVVFPYADLKIFLTANESVRARRRHKELDQKGINTRLSEVEKNIQMRDRIDQTRELSPLQKAPDAITLDNSNMTMEDQLDWFRNLIKKLGK